MKPLTIRIPEEKKETLEGEAAEYDVSVSEYVRQLIEKGREYDELKDRLESREERIEDLEEQLRRRSQVEEKIDVLAERVDETEEPDAPWPVEWWRWFRER